MSAEQRVREFVAAYKAIINNYPATSRDAAGRIKEVVMGDFSSELMIHDLEEILVEHTLLKDKLVEADCAVDTLIEVGEYGG